MVAWHDWFPLPLTSTPLFIIVAVVVCMRYVSLGFRDCQYVLIITGYAPT